MRGCEPYDAEIEAVVFSEAEIQAAVERMAGELGRLCAGESVLLVGVLKGALFLIADLARALGRVEGGPREIRIDFLAVTSYGNSNRSSGEVRLLKDVAESIEGRHVVIVEDIVDNGLTLAYLQGLLGGRHPASLRTCVLLDKPFHRTVDVPIDVVGLEAPDAFIVGYGLDYQERFRNLPYLAKLHESVFAG
jgi:hypoxanthine phosphoribosyltransferase